MKIEVGMYVRLDTGKIGKVIYIKEKSNYPYDYLRITLDSERYSRTTRNVVKASYDIIDLIEVGDIIRFKELRTHLTNDSSTKFYGIYVYDIHDEEEFKNIKKEIKNHKIELLDVLTKEQFELMKYKVGE